MADESATDVAAFLERIKKLTDEYLNAKRSADEIQDAEAIRTQLEKLVAKPFTDDTPVK